MNGRTRPKKNSVYTKLNHRQRMMIFARAEELGKEFGGEGKNNCFKIAAKVSFVI